MPHTPIPITTIYDAQPWQLASLAQGVEAVSAFIREHADTDTYGNLTFSFEFAGEDNRRLIAWLASLNTVLEVGPPSIGQQTRDWMSILARDKATGFEAIAHFFDAFEKHHMFSLPRPLKVRFPAVGMNGHLNVRKSAETRDFVFTLTVPQNLVHVQRMSPETLARLLTGQAVSKADVEFHPTPAQVKTILDMFAPAPAHRGSVFRPQEAPAPAPAQGLTYKVMTALAKGDLKQTVKILHRLYGSKSLGEMLRDYRLAQKSVKNPARAPRPYEMAIRLKMGHEAYKHVEAPTPESPFPEKVVLDKIATALKIDASIIYFKANEQFSPDIDRRLVMLEGKVILADVPYLREFLRSLTSRIQAASDPATQKMADVAIQILRAHFRRHDDFLINKTYREYTGITLRNFLMIFLNPAEAWLPEKETTDKIARLAGLPQDDVNDYVLNGLYPGLRVALDRLEGEHYFKELLRLKGRSKAGFPINKQADEGKIPYYLSDPESRPPPSAKLGFRLFTIRKILGLTPIQMAARVGFEPENWNLLELDQGGSRLTDLAINKISRKLSIPLPILKKWVADTYPEREEAHAHDTRFAPKYSLKRTLAEAIREHASYNEVAQALSGFLALIDPALATTSDEVIKLLMNCDPETRGTTDKRPDVTHWAAFASVFGDKLDTARMWSRVFPEAARIFPTLTAPHPHIELPGEITLESVLGLSVPLELAKLRLSGRPLDKVKIMEGMGYSSSYYVSMVEAFDMSFNDADRLMRVAHTLNIDPRLLYLHKYPWILLAVPVRNPQGEPHPGFPPLPSRKHSPLKGRLQLVQAIRTLHKNVSDGRQVIKEALATYRAQTGDAATGDRELLLRIGFNGNLATRMLECIRVLRDDELLEIIGKTEFPVDRAKLLEGFRKGELLYFMGSDPAGGIDYSYPEGWNDASLEDLDLMGAAETILRALNQKFFEFWKQHLNAPGRPALERKITEGFSTEQIAVFSRLASQAHEALPAGSPEKERLQRLTRKTLYLKFNRRFIGQFKPIRPLDRPVMLPGFSSGINMASNALQSALLPTGRI